MGRYIGWDDVIQRYPEMSDLGGAASFGSSYIQYAEAYIDGQLASHYSVPFSSDNATVRDLCIDATFWRAGRTTLEDAVDVGSNFHATIAMLKERTMVMINNSGAVINNQVEAMALHSNTTSYHNTFGIDDMLNQHPDPDQQRDIRDERDY